MAGSKKKGSKDLSPTTSKVKGGRLVANDSVTLVRGARPAKKDLPQKASTPVKGGRIVHNDNLTLVRHAKPATR